MLLSQFRSILIVYRPKNKRASQLARVLALKLHEKKIKIYTHPKRKLVLGKSKNFLSLTSSSSVDAALVLGGDGTYLETVRLLEKRKTPVLGINIGSLGFLTEVSFEGESHCVDYILKTQFYIKSRNLIDVTVKEKNKSPISFQALNDVVLERGQRGRLLNLDISYENKKVGSVRSDGLIVATPTGSTAYNLSAGGPILHPDSKSFVLTPISPHSLTFRPMIFDHTKELKLEMDKKDITRRASLVVDGQKFMNISSSHQVIIKTSKRKHWTLKSKDYDYFKVLSEKLKFSE